MCAFSFYIDQHCATAIVVVSRCASHHRYVWRGLGHHISADFSIMRERQNIALWNRFISRYSDRGLEVSCVWANWKKKKKKTAGFASICDSRRRIVFQNQISVPPRKSQFPHRHSPTTPLSAPSICMDHSLQMSLQHTNLCSLTKHLQRLLLFTSGLAAPKPFYREDPLC